MKRDLRSFSVGTGFTLMLKIRIASWFIVQHLIFKGPFIPSSIRPHLLRVFGSSIGRRVIIRRGVRVHFPWNLVIGDDSWVGEDVWFVNHEKVEIGSNVCISQRSIICSGGHDYRSASLQYAHKPIAIKDGAWICLDAKILPGVTVGECSVVSAGEIVRKSVPNYSILLGGHVRPIDLPR
jgi:putative colanic acid biosynthesis acetyltransferase WcaF